MNLKEIKEMIDLMNKNSLNELELEKGDMKIRLKKGSGGITQQMLDERLTAGQIRQQAAPLKEPGTVPETKPKNTIEIKAPMVGTFYRSPSPDAPPFIDIGARIEPGQAICIIEAMKLMNEIKSEVKGKVVDILAENGNPIEFGQVLFVIDPAG